MHAPRLSCDLVDRDDLDHRYLAGTLSSSEAEAFEAHYFDCERCWALVDQGLALRATAAGEPRMPNVRAEAPTGRAPIAAPRRRWWVGLAAASVLVTSTVVWNSRRAATPASTDAVRGADAALVASVSMRGDSIAATWHRVNTATDYRVRISAPNGIALLEREVADSAIAFPRSALGEAMTDTIYVSVLARDALRRPVARSALTPLAVVRR